MGLQAFWSYLERVVRLQSLSGQATTPFVALCHAGQQDKALRTLWQAGPHPFAPLRSQELRHPRICAHNPKHLTKIRMPRERSRPLRGEECRLCELGLLPHLLRPGKYEGVLTLMCNGFFKKLLSGSGQQRCWWHSAEAWLACAFSLVAEWIYRILPTIKLKVYTFWGL